MLQPAWALEAPCPPAASTTLGVRAAPGRAAHGETRTEHNAWIYNLWTEVCSFEVYLELLAVRLHLISIHVAVFCQ